jgi:hypothetical protein
LAGETEVLGENLPQCRSVHRKLHMLCPDANPGRRGGKPATNRLSYDTVLAMSCIRCNGEVHLVLRLDYKLHDQRIGVRFLEGDLSLRCRVQTESGMSTQPPIVWSSEVVAVSPGKGGQSVKLNSNIQLVPWLKFHGL